MKITVYAEMWEIVCMPGPAAWSFQYVPGLSTSCHQALWCRVTCVTPGITWGPQYLATIYLKCSFLDLAAWGTGEEAAMRRKPGA